MRKVVLNTKIVKEHTHIHTYIDNFNFGRGLYSFSIKRSIFFWSSGKINMKMTNIIT